MVTINAMSKKLRQWGKDTMKISIENFGPIKKFGYDLEKDIIVTFGDNNIGKSYAMQVVYLLLKNLTEYAGFHGGFYSYSVQFGYSPEQFDEVRKTINAFSGSQSESLPITELVNSVVLYDLSEKFVDRFKNSCENTFGNFTDIIRQDPMIAVEIEKYTLKIAFADEHPLRSAIYTLPTHLKKSASDLHKSRNANGRLDIYYHHDIEAPIGVIADKAAEAIADFSATVVSSVGNVYFLPASRSGIYSGMSAFSSIIAELSKNKAMLTRKIELPGISEPISDYFLMLSNIRNKENSAFSKVYGEIEADILHGTVSFNRSRNTLVYTPQGISHEFEMTEVSSMVSEVAPIVAFLKYIVTSDPKRAKVPKAKPIVFIEEPEAHLHPKNQIKLISLFAQLYKFGIKVIVSSHSNYIFNKLNNLLLKKDISPEIYSAILLRSETGGSRSSFMAIDELGVDDTNFLDVTQDLYNEREALINATV